jgi:hypothetical protein
VICSGLASLVLPPRRRLADAHAPHDERPATVIARRTTRSPDRTTELVAKCCGVLAARYDFANALIAGEDSSGRGGMELQARARSGAENRNVAAMRLE